MDFKIDENLPVELADLLARAGHDAMTVAQQGLQGRADTHVARVCQQECRALVTCDTDFAQSTAYPPEQYAGLLVLRLARQDMPHVLRVFARVVPLLAQQPVYGHLWIIEETRVRIRPGYADKPL